MQRLLALVVVGLCTPSLAQDTPDIPSEKVIVVPMGGPVDAGVPDAPPPLPVVIEPPPPTPLPDAPPPQPPPDAPTDRTLQALPPPTPPPEQLDQNPAQVQPAGPGAMIDGKPREGAFLSGPGSFTFLMHHTLMTGFGVLATQMIPRAIDASPAGMGIDGMTPTGCTEVGGVATHVGGREIASTPELSGRYGAEAKVTNCASIVTGEGARIAYLAGTLLGAGIGFTSAAIWQFNNWLSHRSANFGIITSFIGGMFFGGFTDLFTKDAYAISWMTVIGNTIGAWLGTIIGGGDIPLNKAALVVTGAGWAMIYTALILGIIASTGGGSGQIRAGLDALMITPALGAAAMAIATLKFNPSFGQIMRANLFGTAVGGVVLLLSALLLGPTTGFSHPVPYVLAAVGAIGAKTIVSLLWADAAENPPAQALGPDRRDRKYRSVW